MDEVALRSAHLPDAFVRLAPGTFHELEDHFLERPGRSVRLEPGVARDVQRVEDLAVDVQLELVDRGVADAHRPGVLVPWQPVERQLRKPPLAGGAVHGLQLRRITAGSAKEPVAPRGRLGEKATVDEREEREGRVPQPAESVVPVPDAADLLRQRSGGRRDDAAGRREGEALQRDRRAKDLLFPRTFVVEGLRPVAPPRQRFVERHERVTAAFADAGATAPR